MGRIQWKYILPRYPNKNTTVCWTSAGANFGIPDQGLSYPDSSRVPTTLPGICRMPDIGPPTSILCRTSNRAESGGCRFGRYQDSARHSPTTTNRRESLKILSYYMTAFDSNYLSISTDLRSLYYLLGSGECAKMVLTKHSHLLMVHYWSMNRTISYQPLTCLLRFLCNPDRGGSLRTEFRTCCIATCTNLVLRILPTTGGYRMVLISFFIYGEYRYWGWIISISTRHDDVGVGEINRVFLLCNIIRAFFDTHTLSDVNGEKYVDTMEGLTIVLNTFDWKKLHYTSGSRFALVVFSWLHRQLASKSKAYWFITRIVPKTCWQFQASIQLTRKCSKP